MKEGLIRGIIPVAALTAALSACTNDSTSENINRLNTEVGQIGTQLDSMKQSIDALGTTTIPATTIPDTTTTTETTVPETTTTTEAPKLNLHALFAADIVKGIPTLDSVQVEAELRYVDSTFPEGLINVALAENSGLIAHPTTGEIIPVLPPAYRNASEGGAWYGSWGEGKVSFDGRTYEFPNKVDNVYQTFVIGRPDDSTSEDLNTTIELTEYKPGHFYTNHLVPSHGEIIQDGRVINREWLAQQIWYGINGGTNDGVGAKTVTLDFINAVTGEQTRWIVTGTFTGTDPATIVWVEIPMGS